MATVKIKYRPSTQKGKKGTVYYQIIHKRIVRQIKTTYHICTEEWDDKLMATRTVTGRENEMISINDGIEHDMKRLNAIILKLESDKKEFTADDVVGKFLKVSKDELYFCQFMKETIARLKWLGKARSSETYTSAMNSFRRFLESQTTIDNNIRENTADISLDDMDSDTITAYEAYLKRNCVSPNTSSFYMRNLRAVYNRAVEKNLTSQKFPFKYAYTGVEKTVKRAIPLKAIRQIKEMDLAMNPTLDFAREMFLFSFYTRGMSFVDMAYLRKKDLNAGVLTYRRRKTGRQLSIRWEKCMQDIVNKHNIRHSPYLLPIIKPDIDTDDRKQYIYMGHNVNRGLKTIGKRLGLPLPLTMYVARHAWASIAKSQNIPLSVISEGMGHDSETTTLIYLASLDNMAVDKANKLILKLL